MPQPQVTLINTGDELLLGQVLNTHLGYLSEQLTPLGLDIRRQFTVPDGPEIRDVLEDALAISDIVLLTGGLGPTSDDLTRDVVADYFEAPLEFHEDIFETISGYFRQRNLTMSERVRVQAFVPRGATVLPNHAGTAPGLYLQKDDKHVFCLPGPPRELKPMFENTAAPILKQLSLEAKPREIRVLRVLGVGESAVQDRVEPLLAKFPNLQIGYCARPGEVDVRLISVEQSVVTEAVSIVREELGDTVYGEGLETLEDVVIRLATEQSRKIATAESCTGGMVAHRLTNVPGASAVLDRGWVTYSNGAKVDELGVPADTLTQHGAVSSQVAEAMARGALHHSRAQLAVAITGIAGPGGGSAEKPVGTAWFGIASNLSGEPKSEAIEKRLVPRRDAFKLMASQVALDLLRRRLLK